MHDEPDDLTDDEADVMAHRARAKTMIDRIAAQAKQALSQQGVDLDLFFVTPSSHSVVTFGTMSDPPDELWEQVSAVVSTIVREAVGLDQVRCRQVACASTDVVSMHPALQSSGAAMKYRDITADVSNRFQVPPSHPILTQIAIDPVDWCRLQQLDANNPATAIVGHDEPQAGQMNVYVACASTQVRDRLLDGWG